MPLLYEELLDFPGAVPKGIQMDANTVEQREVKVGQVHSLLVPDMPVTLQARCSAASYQHGNLALASGKPINRPSRRGSQLECERLSNSLL